MLCGHRDLLYARVRRPFAWEGGSGGHGRFYLIIVSAAMIGLRLPALPLSARLNWPKGFGVDKILLQRHPSQLQGDLCSAIDGADRRPSRSGTVRQITMELPKAALRATQRSLSCAARNQLLK
jgi:hypothetical protein